MQKLAAEILAAWRRAERLARELPEGSPEHDAAQRAGDRLRDAFQEHGFLVALASSGVAMEDYLRGQAADVIILDVMLPGEDGLALCRRLRAVSRVPILMLTALGSDPGKRRSKRTAACPASA